MADRKKILLPRSDIPGRAPTLNEIDFGEIAINTHDGKAYIKKNKNGEVSITSIGAEDVDNVYYVSKSGEYGNDGKSLMNAFKTLDSAVAVVYTKQGFKFDETTCERDLHLIMDGVRYDMALGTNYNAITAGQSYKRGNAIKVTSEQLYQTRRSINEERLGMISVPQVKIDATAKNRVSAGFDEIIEILIGGSASTLEYPDPPVEAQTDSNAAAQAILDNKDDIQDAVLDFLNDPTNNFLTGSYDATKCSRDIGIIIDNVARDLTLKGTYYTTTAGWAYKRANSEYVLTDQNEATVAGINHARDYIIALTGVVNDTDIENLFKNVTDVIDGTQTTYPTITFPQTAGATFQNADRVAAAEAIQSNRATLISETTDFINNTYTGIGDTCERDLGIILDAVRRDLLLGTDYNSITAGNAYLRSSSAYVLAEQKNSTITLINYARDLVKTYVSNGALIDTLFAKVTDVLSGAVTTPITTYNFPATGTYASDGNRSTEAAAVISARATLISDVSNYISTNFQYLIYDTVACERDTGFLIDAVVHDLLYGGNTASRQAAIAYFVGTNSQLGSGEEDETVDAYEFLKTQIQAIV